VPTPFSVDTTLAGIVRPGVVWWSGAAVTDRPAGLDAVIAAVSAAVVAAPPADVQTVREMYASASIPETRPSGSAAARVRRGDPFPASTRSSVP
jgi:hypothetical protein